MDGAGAAASVSSHLPFIDLSAGTRLLCECLLAVEPLWTIGACTYIYLTALHIMEGIMWTGLLAGALPFLVRWCVRGYAGRRTPFDAAIGILLLAGLVGVYAAADRSTAWMAFYTLLAATMFYYSFVNYERPSLLIKASTLAAVVCILVVGGYIFLQKPTSLPFYSDLQEWLALTPAVPPEGWSKAPLGGAHAGFTLCAASIIAVLINTIVFGVALFSGRRLYRAVAGVCTVLLLLLLVVSGCGATWIMVAMGMGLLMVWRSRWSLLSLPAWGAMIFWSMTAREGKPFALSGVDWLVQRNIVGRLRIWEGPWEQIVDNPVLGVGLGGYTLPYSHSSYLQFYLDFGLIGLVAVLVGAVMFIKMGWDLWRRRGRQQRWYGLAVGAWVGLLTTVAYASFEGAPECVVGMGEGREFYAISPLLAVAGAVLVISYRKLTEGERDSINRA